MTAEAEASFSDWLDQHVKKGDSDKPSRVVVVMALLERLRGVPSLQPRDHLTDNGMQLSGHDRFVAEAMGRCETVCPVKAGGRRSSNIGAWIEPLLEWIRLHGFVSMSGVEKDEFLSGLQSIAAARLQIINEDQPLIPHFGEGSAVAVLENILDQAQKKKRAKDVAEYLVGAKLQLRFGDGAVEPKNVNTPNRNRPADFHLGDAEIEVTVNLPDKRHLDQINEIIERTASNVWLLVRESDREKWKNAVDATVPKQLRGRVVVNSIEAYVGQNVSEIGKFETPDTDRTLRDLFRIYNERWLPAAGGSGLRIKSPDRDGDPK
jgi:hypothetical protein